MSQNSSTQMTIESQNPQQQLKMISILTALSSGVLLALLLPIAMNNAGGILYWQTSIFFLIAVAFAASSTALLSPAFARIILRAFYTFMAVYGPLIFLGLIFLEDQGAGFSWVGAILVSVLMGVPWFSMCMFVRNLLRRDRNWESGTHKTTDGL